MNERSKRWVVGVWFAGLAAVVPAAWPAGSAEDFVYELQAGDNPWNITSRLLAGQQYWPKLLRHNRIVDAQRLPVGARLRIPPAWLALRAIEVRLLSVHNAVTVRRDGSERPVAPGDPLRAGDVLVTAEGAVATLEIEDGSRILVRPGSALSLVQADGTQVASSPAGKRAVVLRMHLMQGAIESLVKPVQAGGRFEIQTPSGVAAVRGTEYRVSADAQRMTSEVVTGHVQVANASGATRLAAVQGTRVESGRAPEAPTPLLRAPDLAGLPAKAERLPLDLPLPALAGAQAYRTQVAADAAFTQVLSDVVSQSPRVRALDVTDGIRHVRVRGIDARGLEGLVAQRELVVHARPEPPMPLEPAPQAQLTAPQPDLRWARGDEARQVRVQVARASGSGADFSAPVVDRLIDDDGRWTLDQALPLGSYHWRMASVVPHRDPGPWGDPQSFERVLPAPGVMPPEPGAQPMVLRWQAAAGASGYRVQVARAGQLAQPLVDVRTDQAQRQLDVLPPGEYQVRVQALGSDQQAGPWSAPQRFVIPEPTSHWPLLLLVLPWWLI